MGQIRREQNQLPRPTMGENQQNHTVSAVPMLNANTGGNIENRMIDLNAKPQRPHGQASNNQVDFQYLFLLYVFDRDSTG